MAELTAEQAIDKLKSLPEDRQRSILGKLSPDVKKGILFKLTANPQAEVAKYPKTTPEPVGAKIERGAALGVAEGLGIKPSTSPGEVVAGSVKQFATGLKDFIGQTYNDQPVALPQDVRALAAVLDLVPNFIDKSATGLEQGMRATYDALKNKDWEMASQHAASTLTQIAMLRAAREGKPSEAVGKLRGAMAPKDIPVGGEKIPVLKGEAEPGTMLGRTQAGLKRAGIGEGKFTEFAQKQQAAVKQVIRNVAQKTSRMVGPMKAEPAEAMADASDATFAQARPMYDALDKSLVSVPDSLENVSKVTEQAIARARKLGVEITPGSGNSVVIDGVTFTPQSDPVAWQSFKDQGLVPDNAGQPISTYMKIRSQLLKMQRSTSDAALRNKIGDEVKGMNENMETALKDTPLYENWTEANRLWSKGYALRDVADAIRKTTVGTPASAQSSDLAKVPTRLRGPGLVKRLNDLDKIGVLKKAFTPDEISNLRQSADILDRAAEPVGKEFKVGYGPHSTIWRNLIGLPFLPLVHAMTTKAGLEAIEDGNIAAITRLVNGGTAASGIVAGVTAGDTMRELQRKPPGQQKRELQQMRSSNPAMPVGEER